MTAREGNMGNWETISHVTLSCSQYTEYLLNTSSTLRLVPKQSRWSECLSLYFVFCKFKRFYDATMNLWWTVCAQILRSRYFWNITRRQEISPVAKFHHLQGRGFMIQRGILMFIKCLSANQNQLFYIKV